MKNGGDGMAIEGIWVHTTEKEKDRKTKLMEGIRDNVRDQAIKGPKFSRKSFGWSRDIKGDF